MNYLASRKNKHQFYTTNNKFKTLNNRASIKSIYKVRRARNFLESHQC